MTVHEGYPHKPYLGGKLDKHLMTGLCGMADILSVHTESLKSRLTDLYDIDKAKVRVIPHAYYQSHESPLPEEALRDKYQLPHDRKILLSFGSIRWNKGLDILLEAMLELRKEYFLLIAGDIAGVSEKPAGYYMRIMQENGLDTSLRWIKRYISDEEVTEVFKIADAVVLPYRRSFYAQSSVLNLAVGFEKPCVVSDAGGLGEPVREFNLGVVVEAENVESLVEGVRRAFEADGESYGFKLYKRENTWDRVADEYIEIYEELLNSRVKR